VFWTRQAAALLVAVLLVVGLLTVKDQLYRMVLDRFEAEGLEIASSTFGVVELPPVKVHVEAPERAPGPSR
jgi:hypothetical protein